MALIGTFRANIPVASLATLGVILSACYALWLYRKVIFGVLDKPALMGLRDIGRREILILAPLVILTILFVLGRALFWLGYHFNPYVRAFGFGITFYPTVAVYAWLVLFMVFGIRVPL